MKKFRFIILFFIVLNSIEAQQVQWASKLIKYSSDLGGKQFGIKRILGKPDVFPQGGYSANAWSPKKALDGREVIIVGFEKAQLVKQIAVFENLNAGCVVAMSVSTDGEKFQSVWFRKLDYKTPIYKHTLNLDRAYYFGRKRRKIQEVPNVFNPGIEHIILDTAVSGVIAIKVEFNFALLPGQKQVDAIGISDTETPIEVTINSKSEFENLSVSQKVELQDLVPSSICISEDGKKLFTSINVNDKEEIISFTNQNGNWTNKTIETGLNTGDYYNFIDVINPDFLIKGGSNYKLGSNETGFELFKFSNERYQLEGQIKILAYSNYGDFADITCTNDGKILIVAIETDFTQGGVDLYFTTKKEDGTYGMLQNMGKTLNSASDEFTPQLLSDGKTLLFASNGFSTLGNYDLFLSYRQDDTWKNWSEPINLGTKINTPEFDGQPFYDETNEILYYLTAVDGINQINKIKISKELLFKKN